mgnify:CR=1 FL=1
MESWQWFVIGIMTAYLPGVICLALILARSLETKRDDQ